MWVVRLTAPAVVARVNLRRRHRRSHNHKYSGTRFRLNPAVPERYLYSATPGCMKNCVGERRVHDDTMLPQFARNRQARRQFRSFSQMGPDGRSGSASHRKRMLSRFVITSGSWKAQPSAVAVLSRRQHGGLPQRNPPSGNASKNSVSSNLHVSRRKRTLFPFQLSCRDTFQNSM